jgi:hypothetical protein
MREASQLAVRKVLSLMPSSRPSSLFPLSSRLFHLPSADLRIILVPALPPPYQDSALCRPQPASAGQFSLLQSSSRPNLPRSPPSPRPHSAASRPADELQHPSRRDGHAREPWPKGHLSLQGLHNLLVRFFVCFPSPRSRRVPDGRSLFSTRAFQNPLVLHHVYLGNPSLRHPASCDRGELQLRW